MKLFLIVCCNTPNPTNKAINYPVIFFYTCYIQPSIQVFLRLFSLAKLKEIF